MTLAATHLRTILLLQLASKKEIQVYVTGLAQVSRS